VRFASLGGIYPYVFVALYIIIAAFAAIAVYRDAQRRSDLFLGLHPLWWGAITLIGAITGVAAYWLIHYSSLRRTSNTSTETE
jgi:hypothetical protein